MAPRPDLILQNVLKNVSAGEFLTLHNFIDSIFRDILAGFSYIRYMYSIQQLHVLLASIKLFQRLIKLRTPALKK